MHGSGLAYMISTLGQMMSSIRMDTAICHLFPHQSNLSVQTRGWDMFMYVCLLEIERLQQISRLYLTDIKWHQQSAVIRSTALLAMSKIYNLFNLNLTSAFFFSCKIPVFFQIRF